MQRKPTETHVQSFGQLGQNQRAAKGTRIRQAARLYAFPAEEFLGNARSYFQRHRLYIEWLAITAAHRPYVSRSELKRAAHSAFGLDDYLLDEQIEAGAVTGYLKRYDKKKAPPELGRIDKRYAVIVATNKTKVSVKALDYFERRILMDEYGLPFGDGGPLSSLDLVENAALEIQYRKLVAEDDRA